MALNRNDIEMAKWLVHRLLAAPTIDAVPPARPWTEKPVNIEDLHLIEAFIEAVEEHLQYPRAEVDVRSREWRRHIYSKLLEDPEALYQFTQQALDKFGLEDLSRMVAPQIQTRVVDNHIASMSPRELAELLKQHDRLRELIDYLAENDPEFLKQATPIPEFGPEDLDESYKHGYESGREEGYNQGYDQGYREGYEGYGAQRLLEDVRNEPEEEGRYYG